MTRTVHIRVLRPRASVIERTAQQLQIQVRAKTASARRLVSFGPPAPPPEPITRTYLAGQVLGGHRAARRAADGRIVYASADQVDHAHSVLGITTHAADTDAPIELRQAGDLYESSWNWIVGRAVFLGVNGELTQVPPATPVLLVLGIAIAPSTLHVRIAQPILRS